MHDHRGRSGARGAQRGMKEGRRGARSSSPPIFPIELCPSYPRRYRVGLPPSFSLFLAATLTATVHRFARTRPALPRPSLLRSSRECAVSARRHASPRLPEETHAIHASVGSHTRDTATVHIPAGMCTLVRGMHAAPPPRRCVLLPPLDVPLHPAGCLASRPCAPTPPSVRAAPPARGRCRRG